MAPAASPGVLSGTWLSLAAELAADLLLGCAHRILFLAGLEPATTEGKISKMSKKSKKSRNKQNKKNMRKNRESKNNTKNK